MHICGLWEEAAVPKDQDRQGEHIKCETGGSQAKLF